jgi:AcrR family transcriptional regulator
MELLVPALGLREANKVRTRQLISDTATRLFIEQGFEETTVAEIAAAARVSVKTVFNYFATKEEMFFDRAGDLLEIVTRTVTDRPPGTTVAAALHALFADRRVPFDESGWRSLRDERDYERFRSFIAAEQAAPALRARRLVMVDSWIDPLAAAVAGAWGLKSGDRRARSFAAMVVAAMTLRERELSAAVLDRASPRTVERRVRAVVDEAFARIARSFEDLEP